MANAQLRIIYRSNSHAPFWVVAGKSAVWAKNGLNVDTSPQLVREKALEAGSEWRIRGNFRRHPSRRARRECRSACDSGANNAHDPGRHTDDYDEFRKEP